MRKKLLALVLAGVLLGGCGAAIPKLSNGQESIVEFKDGTKYSVDEIWNELKDNYALTAVISKVDTKILEDKYKDDLKDADKFADSRLLQLKAQYTDESGNFDEAKLENALQQYGYGSVDKYLAEQKVSYLKDLATNDFAKKDVSESDMKKYYKNESVGDIKCVHILVKASESDDQDKKKKEAQDIIDAIKKDIKSGTKAEDAFKKYEKDDSVTYQDLGYFNKGDMVPEFEEAAYKLKVGTYSTTPVKTSYGYHVILKLDEKAKESYDKLKDEIKETIAKEKVEKDTAMETRALIALRKEYGVKINDTDVESKYNKYMNYLLNQ